MKNLSIVILLFGFIANATSTKMVFLVEEGNQKHVGISENFSDYRLLTGGSNWHLYPTISADGKRIAFSKGTNPNDLTLVYRNLLTREEKKITEPGFVLQSQFAKDGDLLFFTEKVGDINKIGYANLITNTKTYINEDKSSYFPAPFQSGEVIVYQRNADKREIVLFNILENKKEIIGYGMAPAVSKDEKYIAYTSKINENWDIFIYDRFEKKTIKVTNHHDSDFSPTFDKDNNLIYTSDRLENGVFSIFSQSFDSWKNSKNVEKLLISKKNVSFYAPKISGLDNYKIELNPEMPGEPRSSFGAITHENKTYIVGGHQGAEHTYPPESFTGRVTVYDNFTRTWKNLAPRLNPSHGFQLAAEGNYLYAFGGFAYEENNNPKWKSIDVVERYDIKKNIWEEIGHMPRRRSSNVVVKIENLVYLIGGWDATPKSDNDIDGTFHEEIDVYDIKNNSWKTIKTKLPKKRRAFSAIERLGKIYLVGGISEGGSHFSLLEDFTEFNPANSQFKEFPKLPFPTFAPASGYLNNKAFMFGGMFKTGAWDYEYVPHIYQFDFDKMIWEHTGRYMTEYKGFSQVVSSLKCLGVLGGHSYQNNSDRPVDTFERFCELGK